MWQSFLMVPNQITEETLLQRAWEYQGQKNGGPSMGSPRINLVFCFNLIATLVASGWRNPGNFWLLVGD